MLYFNNKLIVRSNFGFNYWNRLDLIVLILGINLKLKSISIILELIRFDLSRYSIPILGIESNCQEIENNIIISRITNFRTKYFINKMQYLYL